MPDGGTAEVLARGEFVHVQSKRGFTDVGSVIEKLQDIKPDSVLRSEVSERLELFDEDRNVFAMGVLAKHFQRRRDVVDEKRETEVPDGRVNMSTECARRKFADGRLVMTNRWKQLEDVAATTVTSRRAQPI